MTRGERRAAVLAVGDELLDGSQLDLNSTAAARFLGELGWSLERVVVVGDQEDEIASVLGDLANDHPLVLLSGGLGPTLDDLTRHGMARAAGVDLHQDPEAWGQILDWYERSGRSVPASNERQAMMPVGSRPLQNDQGTAPGIHMRLGDADLFALPGPPREFTPMLDVHLGPWLREAHDGDSVRSLRRFYLFGISESVFADQVGDWMKRGANPLMGVTAKEGVLAVRLVAQASQQSEADALLAARGAEFTERLGSHVFSEDHPDPAQALGAELLRTATTVTTAESCTGGGVAQALTGVAGISEVFHEGAVTYSNESKITRLGVDPDLLARHGAVSGPVAEAMARGAAERSGAALALSTTGVAGPGGGTDDKPVGLVWFGAYYQGREISLEKRWLPVGRSRIRRWATAQALILGLQTLRGSTPG